MKEALLIIDMQKDVVDRMVPGSRKVVPNIRKVLEAFRKAQKTVFHIRRIHKADGSDVELFRRDSFEKAPFCVEGTKGAQIVDELLPYDGEYVIDKRRFSGFFNTSLDMLLRGEGITDVIIAGIQTPNCIRATAVDALALDYAVTVLSDSTMAKKPQVHKANLSDMKNMGVNVIKTKEYIIPNR